MNHFYVLLALQPLAQNLAVLKKQSQFFNHYLQQLSYAINHTTSAHNLAIMSEYQY